MASQIKTRFYVISDTHGDDLLHTTARKADVAIHCGDLTEESKLDEYRRSIEQLKNVDAPLKLVIAGNHDWTLDDMMFNKKVDAVKSTIDDDLIKKEYGSLGQARQLFENADTKAAGIVLLDEGTHTFELENGAVLKVFASPYTPSKSDWGFQYHPDDDHEWAIDSSVDLVITHGPPKGVFDYTDSRERAGSPSLFAAVAKAKPKMHCFGHIHESWGAKKVVWRDDMSETPTHFTDIDNDESTVIETLSNLRTKKFDSAEDVDEKEAKKTKYNNQGYCEAVNLDLQVGKQTLFVNAAIEGSEEGVQQWAWMVDLDLTRSQKTSSDETILHKKRKRTDETCDCSTDHAGVAADSRMIKALRRV